MNLNWEKNGRFFAHNSTEARKLQKEHREHFKEIIRKTQAKIPKRAAGMPNKS